jgi:uncharacterized protein (DUF302 family)
MSLKYGYPGIQADMFQHVATSTRPFVDVLAALHREIDGAGMKVLHEIDPQGALKSVGQIIGGSRLVFFFHPNLVARLLQTDWSAIVEVPLKLAVMELPDGTVSIRIADPAAAFARYGNPALTAFGQELAATCERVVGASV